MSRGLGKVQRSIINALSGDSKVKRADVIAKEVYDTDKPTVAQGVAIRRAIRALAKSGLVGCGEFYSDTGKDDQFDHWIQGLYLFAWLPGNQPDVKPITRADWSEVERRIIEYLTSWGVQRAYSLGRSIRYRLTEDLGFNLYEYVPQYNRALHRLENQGSIVRFWDDRGRAMIALGRNKLSVSTEYSVNDIATLKETSPTLDDIVTLGELDYSVTLNEEVPA